MSPRTRQSAQATAAQSRSGLSTILVSQDTCFTVLSLSRERFLLGCRRGDWLARKDRRTWFARVADIERFLFGESPAEQSASWDPQTLLRRAAKGGSR